MSGAEFPNLATRRSTRLATHLVTSAEVSIASYPEERSIASRTNKRERKRGKKDSAVQSEDGEVSDLTPLEEDILPSIPLEKGAKKRKKSKKEELSEENGEFSPKKSPRKKREPMPEPIYVIPDVEKKETTFKGRLGYACLNTVLRTKKPARDSVFCSRTCRLDSLKKNGIEWVKDLGRKNAEDLLTMIQWNEDNNIRFLRLSSEMFPYASHGIHGYSLDYCAPLLAHVGGLANKLGHRLTTHPGQYTQLGSPRPEVIGAAVRELEYHCEMLDRMGVGPDGVMIVHGGGVYDDKAATIGRIKNTITDVLSPHVRARLVLENDEICYNAEDLLPLCEELDVPLVFDYHHDALNPSSITPRTIIQRANAIWERRGIKPKQHLSEPRPGAVTLMEQRAHADRCETLPVDLPDDMDLMIEAKDKEQAVLHLYRIYGLQPVNYASLRPPDANPTKETKGRKSNKRARAQAQKLKDEEYQGSLASDEEGESEEVETRESSGTGVYKDESQSKEQKSPRKITRRTV